MSRLWPLASSCLLLLALGPGCLDNDGDGGSGGPIECSAELRYDYPVYDRSQRDPLDVLCLDATADLDPAQPGFQTECSLTLLDHDHVDAGLVDWCDAPTRDPARPCLARTGNDANVCTLGGMAVRTEQGTVFDPGSVIAIRCRVAC